MNIGYGIFFVGLIALIIKAIRTMEFLKVDTSGSFNVSENSTIFKVTSNIINVGVSAINIEHIAIQIKDKHLKNKKDTEYHILKGLISEGFKKNITYVHSTKRNPRRINIVFHSKDTLRLINISFKINRIINENCINATLIIVTNNNIFDNFLTKSIFCLTGGMFAKKKFKFKFYPNKQ